MKPELAWKLIHTSGTTGPPTAVIISQDNVQFTALHFHCIVEAATGPKRERLVSYLPCSHIAANTIDITGEILNRFTMYLEDRNAIRATLVKMLRKARPTVLIAFSLVFEKMQKVLLKAAAKNGLVKRVIEHGRRASVGHGQPHATRAATMSIHGGIISLTRSYSAMCGKHSGVDDARRIINTSSSMHKATDLYFKQFGFRLVDLYGMSEATGSFTLNYPEYRAGTSGKVLDGVECKLVNNIAHNEGELCFRGRNMFMGYQDNREETEKTMDDEGFVHGGDVGKIDEDGFLTIAGRPK